MVLICGKNPVANDVKWFDPQADTNLDVFKIWNTERIN